MNYLLISAIAVAIGLQGMCQKQYQLTFSGRGVFIFSSLSALFSALFFFAVNRGLTLSPALLPYSILFALGYAFAVVFVVLACGHGSLALTNLMVSFSSILPTVYGLLFLGEAFTPALFLGIILLISAIVVVNFPQKGERVNLRWFCYAMLTFLGNGLTGIIVKLQAIEFQGAYGNDFMIIALALVALTTFPLALASEKGRVKVYLTGGALLFTVCGLLNGFHNTLVVYLSSRMPASIMFPLLSAGGILITLFVATVFYKEKLTKLQWIGLFLGIGSVVLLSI